jgi:HJR/Mrr/RecB family endonuclease
MRLRVDTRVAAQAGDALGCLYGQLMADQQTWVVDRLLHLLQSNNEDDVLIVACALMKQLWSKLDATASTRLFTALMGTALVSPREVRDLCSLILYFAKSLVHRTRRNQVRTSREYEIMSTSWMDCEARLNN